MDEVGPVNAAACAILAVLSVFDYPSRQWRHDAFRRDFASAMSRGDAPAMEAASRKGADLLPDDPVWAYNLACSLSRLGRKDEALDALGTAIRLGFRDDAAMAADADLRPLAGERRFEELLDEAADTKSNPILTGPLSARPASGVLGGTVMFGEHNLLWDLDSGCYNLLLKLDRPDDAAVAGSGNLGDMYFNRDGGHSVLDTGLFPGITRLLPDAEARERNFGLDFPDLQCGRPVFGNCSRAMTEGPMWRSLPRALLTTESRRLPLMQRLYFSNQIWVFPAVADCPPAGTNGDVFASTAPYWIATQGKSWSDQYYLKAALEISRSLRPDVKRTIVAQGLLAPFVQTIIRKSLKGVSGEDDYLTEKAHPTAFPAFGLDMEKLKTAAASTTSTNIPPVAAIKGVAVGRTESPPTCPEMTYATKCAWAFTLRTADAKRSFAIIADEGADEYAFATVHDPAGACTLERLSSVSARVTLDKTKMNPVSRVDVALFARRAGSGWGAPSFVSFAVSDPSAPYSDPYFLEK